MNTSKQHLILWNKHFKIPMDLINYILVLVNRYYPSFDKGHNLTHAYDVINKSLFYAKEYSKVNQVNLNYNLVFASAALHDIGLSVERKLHHVYSGKIISKELYSDLLNWFTKNEIAVIIAAVEDHRDSLKGNPRSIYGSITSQADRDNDVELAIKRAVLWGIKNLPNSTPDERFQSTYDDVIKKSFNERIMRLDIPSVRNTYNKMDSYKDKLGYLIIKYMRKYDNVPRNWVPSNYR